MSENSLLPAVAVTGALAPRAQVAIGEAICSLNRIAICLSIPACHIAGARIIKTVVTISPLDSRLELRIAIADSHTKLTPNGTEGEHLKPARARVPYSAHIGVHILQAVLVCKTTWNSVLEDRLLGRAAELAFYFLFALFPTLFSASSILGLVAKSASKFYDEILAYLALVIPTQALGTVLSTFNETTAHATPGKLTFGVVAAIWSASVGISAIQDSLNTVYKIQESRTFFVARLYAIALTIILTITVTLILSAMLGGDFIATLASHQIANRFLVTVTAVVARLIGWAIATALLALSFAVIYQWAPDLKARRWRWLSPGSAFGILGWLLASLGLRVYLSYFNSYSLTYGSLGAVIILLTWFYITGLMILVGAEIDKQIESA